MTTIDLFPLGLVLFPETEIPLHIYEEKYKKLISKAIKNKSQFGVNQSTSKKFFEVGCIAEVSKIVHRYEDGQYDILVRGTGRYEVKRLFNPKDEIWTGEVEYVEDYPELIDVYLVAKCVDYYNQIADTVKRLNIIKLDAEKLRTPTPSFLMSTKAGLTNQEKQTVLEFRSENKRLHFLYNHLKSLVPMLQQAEHLSQIIKNDGYIQYPPP